MNKYKGYACLLLLLLTVSISSGCMKADINNNATVTNKPTSAVLATPFPTYAILDENLCGKNEGVLFSFHLVDSDKIVSVCVSIKLPDYMMYRFGTKDNIELEYPADKDDTSWSKFTYSNYLRAGGADNLGLDLNYLTFERGGYEYKIYQEYSAEDDASNVGIIVKNLATGQETDMMGDNNSIQGDLKLLRGNDKVNVEVQ